MLTGAIPEYRLPRETLRKEIDSLLNENVEVKLGRALGRDFTVDSLLADRFDAVYLAIGSHTSKRLDAKGEDVEGVIPGIRFLKAHNLHGQTLARGRVGIVGGGNSAIDAARVAVRQKGVASVTIYYRRTEAEMPAYAEEIRAALDEGIRILPLLAPVEVLAEGGKLRAVRFRKNELGEPDASGRRRPVPVPGSEFDEPLDTLVVGIGEEPDKGALAGLAVTRKGTLDVNPESLAAGRPGVFGGGDAAAGPRTVIEAIADGKTAALMIDRYLAGKLLRLLPEVKLPSVHVAPPAEAGEADAGTARVHAPHLDCAKRTGCFSEVELSVSEEDAVREARRCMRCDLDFTRPA
jgi:NADPH-dependent glutamate synthase beta subunit-like oxidoreductase